MLQLQPNWTLVSRAGHGRELGYHTALIVQRSQWRRDNNTSVRLTNTWHVRFLSCCRSHANA